MIIGYFSKKRNFAPCKTLVKRFTKPLQATFVLFLTTSFSFKYSIHNNKHSPMKVILLSLGILIFNIHLSPAQTKKIALRSHSGANSSFTIYVPDEFGLGPANYNLPTISKNKTCSLIVKTIDPKQIQVKDSMDSIKFCIPLPPDSTAKPNSTTPKSKPRAKRKKGKKTAKKITTTATTNTEQQEVALENKQTKPQLAGFVPTESSESLLMLLLSIPALLFFIVTIKSTS
jgi:hypothetical protein